MADYGKFAELLSSGLHPKTAEALSIFLPGLFFEGCLLVGAPHRVGALLAAASLDRAVEIFLALLFALVIGSACLMWVRLLHLFLRIVFRRSALAWARFLEHRLIPWASKREFMSARNGAAGAVSRPMYIRFVRNRWAKMLNAREGSSHVRRAWLSAARAVLDRHGVDVRGTRLDAWSSTVGSPQAAEERGNAFTAALHATGWAGLIAIYVAPELKVHVFLDLCLLLIVYGLLHSVSLAAWSANPALAWVLCLRNTWGELKELGPVGFSSASKVDESVAGYGRRPWSHPSLL